MIINPTDKQKEKKYPLRLSNEQWSQLKAYADKHNLKVAVVIRLMLDKVLKEEAQHEEN